MQLGKLSLKDHLMCIGIGTSSILFGFIFKVVFEYFRSYEKIFSCFTFLRNKNSKSEPNNLNGTNMI